MDGFVDRLKSAVRVSEEFYAAISTHPKVRLERMPNGTNVTRMTLNGADPKAVAARLAPQGVIMPTGTNGVISLGVNETWNRTPGAELARTFVQALG